MITDERLRLWCLDVVNCIADQLPSKTVEDIREIVNRAVGGRALYRIAGELSNMARAGSDASIERMDSFLTEKHGFSSAHFFQRNLKQLMAMVKRGKINSLKEYRVASEFLNDGPCDDNFSRTIDELVGQYEVLLSSAKAEVVHRGPDESSSQ